MAASCSLPCLSSGWPLADAAQSYVFGLPLVVMDLGDADLDAASRPA